ncbi:Transposon Ty1-PR3 Gag-Pol polyprotein [Gracilariopsis chorda]|uniref:Transposon Ty1-PR3 Gag-Pol polyprotein n=1 Tax=Gracilariopsis chorda TaxID=448386 RepID=A0A2V3IXU4_9FLOR|nr:Transposon Ty1-PR3 Gag-Pol polyprotein [Gracilariopsis chorda]|eukprot:PXF46968.1 Transposon Ty1-PR3 Gag-Pol polyprotein [Gracilariopsis chorda]
MGISTALRVRTPEAAKHSIPPGDHVWIYRETDSIHKRGHFSGPLKVLKMENKQVFLNYNGKLVQYSVSQCIPDTTPTQNAPDQNATDERICITEILKPGDSRQQLPQWKEAKRKELEGLTKRKLLNINVESETPIFKARMIAQGYKDPEKHRIVHEARTMQIKSIRLIVSLAHAPGFQLWSADIKQAYIQSKVPLTHDVYLRPVPELGLPISRLLKIQRPIYGMTEAGDLWSFTFMSHITEELKMTPFTSDRAFLFRHNERSNS